MRAPISVIIPTLDAGADLGPTLASLGEGLEAGLIRELIFTDGGSSDGTLAIAASAGAHVINGAPGRGGQLRRGCQAAHGDWFLVLHADTALSPGWSTAVLAHLRDGRTDRAAYFRLAFRDGGRAGRIVAGWANLRSTRAGLPYGDQGLLIHRDLYHDTGGYPDIPLMEDVAIARALRGRLTVLGATASTSARRYLSQGWLRRGALNLSLLARYLTGTPPERLARAYTRRR